MALEWYVLHTKPHKECALCDHLCEEGWQCFNPCIKVKPVNPRSREIKPYFPGYFFVRLDLERERCDPFRWMQGSLGLVRYGEQPAAVPEPIINGIRRTVNSLLEPEEEFSCDLHLGEEVLIEEGPMTGYRTLFDAHISGTERVWVLLKILSEDREIPVELEMGAIRKLE